MFVLITYDVNITSPHGEKRLRNVARVCLNYGKRVQNSVFECILTEAQFVVSMWFNSKQREKPYQVLTS